MKNSIAPNSILRRVSAFWALLLLAVIMALMFQGSRGLFEPDEGRYTNVALQILERNDWISLHRNEWSLHFTKPPITYWSIALSLSIFGNNEWAVRLPMAIAFVATVALMFAFGRLYVQRRPWLPALLYLLSPTPFLAAYTVNTDTLLCLFITAFFYCYARASYLVCSRFWLDAMWIALGLAFLTKGPPSLLALLVVIVHSITYGRARDLFRPIGIFLFMAIGLGWYVLVILRHPGLLDYILGYEVMARIASDTHNRAPQWYGFLTVFVPVLLLATLPALLLRPWRWPREVNSDAGKDKLLWLWLVLPFCVFSLSGSKMPLYVLWLVPALILLLSRHLQDFVIQRKHVLAMLIWIVLLLGLKWLFEPVLRYNGKDSSLYAEQLQKLLPDSPKRIIFVDSSARYGLALYFPATVSKISSLPFEARISDSPYDHTLSVELTEKPSGGRVFITASNKQEEFVRQVNLVGHQAIRLGFVGKGKRQQVLFTLQSEFRDP